jgi:hypothetical protein
MRKVSPIVYTGLTLTRDEVLEVIPNARVRPPISRGDLYRDRIIGNSVFLIIDGVFQQREAISPREVIDVAKSGAVVVGSSSMGALRAAECWPVGVVGVGSIYRLYRRGILESDDEVAVAFDPLHRIKPSVALINVRYSVSRLVKQGHLNSIEAKAIVEVAMNTYFAERSWKTILERAGIVNQEQIAALLEKYNLKKADAYRSVRSVARSMSSDAAYGKNQVTEPLAFQSAEMTREPAHLEPAIKGIVADKRGILDWLFCSGLYTKYASATFILLIATNLKYLDVLESTQVDEAAVSNYYDARRIFTQTQIADWQQVSEIQSETLHRAINSRISLAPALFLLYLSGDEKVRETIWSVIIADNDLESRRIKRSAIASASTQTIEKNLTVTNSHYSQAELEIATDHCFHSWAELRDHYGSNQDVLERLRDYRQELALAKCFRSFSFMKISANDIPR